jgi:hypothetical protein
MREQELNYLRSELNQNVNLSSERTHRLVGHIMLIWGGALVLANAKESFPENIFALFMMETIFFISVVVLYFLSLRNFDNLKSMNMIAAYIAIFYEKRPNAKKDWKIFWELSRFEMENKSNENVNKTNEELDEWYKEVNSKLKNILNKEYYWLLVIAILIKSFLLFVFLYKHLKIDLCCVMDIVSFLYEYFKNPYCSLNIIIIIVCISYIIISILLLPKMNNLSMNKERGHYIKKEHLKAFLDYAIETEHYTEKEAEERFGKDFCDEISNYKN